MHEVPTHPSSHCGPVQPRPWEGHQEWVSHTPGSGQTRDACVCACSPQGDPGAPGSPGEKGEAGDEVSTHIWSLLPVPETQAEFPSQTNASVHSSPSQGNAGPDGPPGDRVSPVGCRSGLWASLLSARHCRIASWGPVGGGDRPCALESLPRLRIWSCNLTSFCFSPHRVALGKEDHGAPQVCGAREETR